MSKNKVQLTEYQLQKAAQDCEMLYEAVYDCIDMSQEENCNTSI